MTVFIILYGNLANGEQPIVISDVLLTSSAQDLSNEERYKKTYIPSVGGKFPHLSGNALISGLMQKLYILDNGHLMVFAGNVRDAGEFHDAQQLVKNSNELFSVCRSYRNRIQFAILALDVESKSVLLCCSDDCNVLEPGSYGKVIIGGSGESVVRDLILKHQVLPFCGDEYWAEIARALCLVSEALSLDDSFPSRTLDNGFGAYYEIGIFANDSFIKLERVLFSFWEVTIQDDNPRWMPTKMFFHEYVDGILVVRRITLAHEAGDRVIWQDCYGIGGLGVNSSTNRACSEVSMTIPQPIIEMASVEFEGATFRFFEMNQSIVKFKSLGKNWDIEINFDLLKKYSEKIAENVALYANRAGGG